MRYPQQSKFMIETRAKYNITQRMIADETKKVSPQFVSKIECGISPISTTIANALLKLCPTLTKQSIVDAYISDAKKEFESKLKRRK